MQETQNTKIWCYDKTPFSIENSNPIRFYNSSDMESFFTTNSEYINIMYSDSKISKQKQTNYINVEGDYERWEHCTYLRFLNEYGTMYYCFVTDIIDKNQGTTHLIYEVDPWNTYQYLLNNIIFSANVQQSHQPLMMSNTYNILPLSQGYNAGSRQIVDSIKVTNPNLRWLVIVAKPSIKVSSSDTRTDYSGFTGTPKSFRYFIMPIDPIGNNTYNVVVNGVTYSQQSLPEYISTITNKFVENSTNTVNQIVNMYTTVHCGLNYTLNDNTVTINSSSFNLKTYTFSGNSGSTGSNTVIQPGSGGSGLTGTDNSLEWNTTLKYGSNTFSVSMAKRLVTICRNYQIIPSYVLAQIYSESYWGASNVAKTNNNWSGITWGGKTKRTSGVTVSRGSARPSSEGGYYVKYASVEDWLTDFMYLLRPKSLGTGGFYNVSGKTTLQAYTRGLFKVGGASYDYAASGYNHYIGLMTANHNNIIKYNTQAKIDELNKLVYNGNWIKP